MGASDLGSTSQGEVRRNEAVSLDARGVVDESGGVDLH